MQQTHLPNCVCGLPCTGNVLFGEKCGCFFHWRCIENVDMGCPNHGPAFPLAYTKKTCFCVGCQAAGDATKHRGRVKLCRCCGDTILERIVSLVKDDYGIMYKYLFQSCFVMKWGSGLISLTLRFEIPNLNIMRMAHFVQDLHCYLSACN